MARKYNYVTFFQKIGKTIKKNSDLKLHEAYCAVAKACGYHSYVYLKHAIEEDPNMFIKIDMTKLSEETGLTIYKLDELLPYLKEYGHIKQTGLE